MTETIVIDRLGAQGDGVADAPGGPVYVPYALAGETVAVERQGNRTQLADVLQASPDRVTPACRHFGACGGCSLQHLEHGAYLAFKRERVVEALASRGIETPVADTIACPPASRRRVGLSARREGHGIVLGYNRALSHDIVEIVECPIAHPDIVAALPMLRQLATIVCATRSDFRISVTRSDTGLDVALAGSGDLNEQRRAEAVRFAVASRLARLSVDGEILVEPVRPSVTFGTAGVVPPPAAFLQAVAGAEAAMAGLVSGHLAGAKRVADLFAGCGAFALRLAARAEVHAVEAEPAALAALERGFRETTGLRRVTVERRDLFRRPLTAKDLASFDGVVFDPPRAGAEEQATQIARSDVPFVAAVSCNPATLARDLRILVDGGYRIVGVTPVDQFLWSAHVEAVALLSKPRRRR